MFTQPKRVVAKARHAVPLFGSIADFPHHSVAGWNLDLNPISYILNSSRLVSNLIANSNTLTERISHDN